MVTKLCKLTIVLQDALPVRRADDLIVAFVIGLVQIGRGGGDVRVPRRVLQRFQLHPVVRVVGQHAVAQPVCRRLAQGRGRVQVAPGVRGTRGVGEDSLDRFGRRFVRDPRQFARTAGQDQRRAVGAAGLRQQLEGLAVGLESFQHLGWHRQAARLVAFAEDVQPPAPVALGVDRAHRGADDLVQAGARVREGDQQEAVARAAPESRRRIGRARGNGFQRERDRALGQVARDPARGWRPHVAHQRAGIAAQVARLLGEAHQALHGDHGLAPARVGQRPREWPVARIVARPFGSGHPFRWRILEEFLVGVQIRDVQLGQGFLRFFAAPGQEAVQLLLRILDRFRAQFAVGDELAGQFDVGGGFRDRIVGEAVHLDVHAAARAACDLFRCGRTEVDWGKVRHCWSGYG